MTKSELKIAATLKRCGHLNLADISRRSGVSIAQTRRSIGSLLLGGLVRRSERLYKLVKSPPKQSHTHDYELLDKAILRAINRNMPPPDKGAHIFFRDEQAISAIAGIDIYEILAYIKRARGYPNPNLSIIRKRCIVLVESGYLIQPAMQGGRLRYVTSRWYERLKALQKPVEKPS